MNALRQNFDIAGEVSPPQELARELALELPLAADLSPRWQALHELAREIARLGQLGAERADDRVAAFPGSIAVAPAWRRGLAERALSDLVAMLEPGLAALRAIAREGRDPTAAAVSLWREFHRARCGIVDLAACDDTATQ